MLSRFKLGRSIVFCSIRLGCVLQTHDSRWIHAAHLADFLSVQSESFHIGAHQTKGPLLGNREKAGGGRRVTGSELWLSSH